MKYLQALVIGERNDFMVLCNSMIYRFVTNKYYDYLKQFNPIKRSAEIFRLELENLTLNLKDDDEIFGWFVFENSENYDVKVFPDCRIDRLAADASQIADITLCTLVSKCS